MCAQLHDYLYAFEPPTIIFGPEPTPSRKRFAAALFRLSRHVSVFDVSDKFGTGCSEGSVIKFTRELVDKLCAKRTEIIGLVP